MANRAEYDPNDKPWAPFHGDARDPGQAAQPGPWGSNISRDTYNAAQDAGIGHQGLDPALADKQDQMLRAIGQHAFGGPEPGSDQQQERIMTSPYHNTAGATRQVGQSPGTQLGAALTTTGQAQLQGQSNAQQFTDQQSARRMEATGAYGQAAGQMRGQQGQLAQFNATQQGDLVNQLYQMMYGMSLTEQQRKDAQNAQTNQGIEQAGMGIVGAFGKMAGA